MKEDILSQKNLKKWNCHEIKDFVILHNFLKFKSNKNESTFYANKTYIVQMLIKGKWNIKNKHSKNS